MGLFWNEERVKQLEEDLRATKKSVDRAFERIEKVEKSYSAMRYQEMRDMESEIKELRAFFSNLAKAFNPVKNEDAEGCCQKVEEISS